MDKLKPVLAHKFWILFGLALIIPLVGWWMATGAIGEQIDTRWKKLDETKPTNTASAPNDKWVEAMTKINAEQQRKLKLAGWELWNTQKSLMTWPPVIASRMEGMKHRENFRNELRVNYRNLYFDELEKVLEIVEPLDQWERTGKVVVGPQNLPYTIQRQQWAQAPPLSKEMWDAQEDLWLTRAIMEAIARTNEGSTSIGDSVVKQIQMLNLMGGSRVAAGAAPAAGDSYAGGGAEAMGMETMPGGMYPGGMMDEGYGGMGPGGQQQGVDFDPTEEFGPPDELPTAAGAEGTAGASGDAGGTYAGESTYAGGTGYPGGGMGYGAQGNASADRYIDKEEGAPFKTRGFYLKVRMDHRRLPELLGQLVSMPWPTQIVRVHQASAEAGSSGTGSPGGGGFPGGGMSDAGLPGGGGFGGGGHGAGGGGGGGFGGAMPMPMGGPMMGGGGFGGFGGGMPGGESYGGESYGSAYGNPYGQPAGNRGPLSQEEQAAVKAFQEQYNVAMADPYLADVVIAGLMSIYNPPPAEEASPEEQAQEAPVPLPATETPEAEGAAPSAGLPTPQGLMPATRAGAPASEGAATPEGVVVPPQEATSPLAPLNSTAPATPEAAPQIGAPPVAPGEPPAATEGGGPAATPGPGAAEQAPQPDAAPADESQT